MPIKLLPFVEAEGITAITPLSEGGQVFNTLNESML